MLDFLFYCFLHEECYNYFFSTSLQEIYDNKQLEWKNILLKKESLKDLYFSFLNVNGDHWVFIILDFSNRQFVVFDSSSSVSKVKIDDLAQNIERYLEFRDNSLGCSSSKKQYKSNWIGFQGECSKQKDGNNCGIFVLEVSFLFVTKLFKNFVF